MGASGPFCRLWVDRRRRAGDDGRGDDECDDECDVLGFFLRRSCVTGVITTLPSDAARCERVEREIRFMMKRKNFLVIPIRNISFY